MANEITQEQLEEYCLKRDLVIVTQDLFQRMKTFYGMSAKNPEVVRKGKELFRLAMIRRLNELDKSQTWLAKQLHTDPSNISLYVSGKRVPRANTFLRICDILEIDPKNVWFE